MDNQSDTPVNKDENENGGTSIDVVSRPNLSDISQPSSPPQEPDSTPTPPAPALSAPTNKIGSSSSDNKSKSKLLPMLLLLLVIILFVGGIYGVYAWQHSKVTSLTVQVNTLDTQVNSLNKEVSKQATVSITTPSSTTSTTTVFKIPELGIEFTVPNTLADLTYSANSAKTLANLSTQTLTDLDAACTASSTTGSALGNVTKTDGQFKTATGVTLIKQYPTYYISYTAAPSACSKDSETASLTTTLTTELKNSFSTIQTIST